jgi:DNA-binding MarR family transcriptional regulator
MSMESAASTDEASDVITDLLLTATRLMVAITAQSFAQVDETITIQRFRTLMILSKRGSANLTTLAAQTGLQPPHASRLLDRLVSAGLIDRQPHPTSRRELLASLTARGHEVVRQITERRRAEVAGILAKMPPPERQELVRVLAAFTTAGGELIASYDVET